MHRSLRPSAAVRVNKAKKPLESCLVWSFPVPAGLLGAVSQIDLHSLGLCCFAVTGVVKHGFCVQSLLCSMFSIGQQGGQLLFTFPVALQVRETLRRERLCWKPNQDRAGTSSSYLFCRVLRFLEDGTHL